MCLPSRAATFASARPPLSRAHLPAELSLFSSWRSSPPSAPGPCLARLSRLNSPPSSVRSNSHSLPAPPRRLSQRALPTRRSDFPFRGTAATPACPPALRLTPPRPPAVRRSPAGSSPAMPTHPMWKEAVPVLVILTLTLWCDLNTARHHKNKCITRRSLVHRRRRTSAPAP